MVPLEVQMDSFYKAVFLMQQNYSADKIFKGFLPIFGTEKCDDLILMFLFHKPALFLTEEF